MEQFELKDHSAGWIPSDDIFNGRKNGYPRFDNVCLDKNGAIVPVGSFSGTGSALTGTAMKSISSSARDYFIDDGYRVYSQPNVTTNPTLKFTGSAVTLASRALGKFKEFIFASAGNTLKKIRYDTDVVSNWGIAKATAAPAIENTIIKTATLSGLADLTVFEGTVTHVSTIIAASMPASAPYRATAQFGNVGTTNLQDFTPFAFIGETDFIDFKYNYSDDFEAARIDFLLDTAVGGVANANYFSCIIERPSDGTGEGHIQIRRADFERTGLDIRNWGGISGIKITVVGSSNVSGVTFSFDTAQLFFYAKLLPDGDYEFSQVNCYYDATTGYLAKSALGPSGFWSTSLGTNPKLTLQAPTDPQVNFIRVYVRGVGARAWYMDSVIPYPGSLVFINDRRLSQLLTFNITYQPTLSSVLDLAAKGIQHIVGPIEGRLFIVSNGILYPTDFEDPELFDSNLGIKIVSHVGETVKWVTSIANGQKATIFIGTNFDIYILTGTFVSLPDGTVDFYFRPLESPAAPVSEAVTTWDGNIIYLSKRGWVIMSPAGDLIELTSPNLDLLYIDYSVTIHGYTTAVAGAAAAYSCTVVLNKLYCAENNRLIVYDLVRKYWYNITHSAKLTHRKSSGELIIQDSDNVIKIYSNNTRTGNQCKVRTFALDFGNKEARKTIHNVKIRGANTTNLALTVYANGASYNSTAATNSDYEETSRNLVNGSDRYIVCKWLELELTITGADFSISNILLYFDTHPPLVNFIKLLNDNFGTNAIKKIGVWPHVFDTLGQNITFTPYIDGVAATAVTINTNRKQTVQVPINGSGVDYGAIITGPYTFEHWGVAAKPEVLQVLPTPKNKDIIGPIEIFKYARVHEIEIRIISDGTTIPYNIYSNDELIHYGEMTLQIGKDTPYLISLPKGVAGQILKIELGTTAFMFYRYYCRIKVTKSGTDTDNTWVSVE